MWVDANVTVNAARTILKHLYAKFGFRISVPMKQISAIGDIRSVVTPKFGEYIKRDKKKKKIHKINQYCEEKKLNIGQQNFAN